MAANFWTSTHYKQLLDQEEVDVVHPVDKDKGITLEDFKLIKMHMANYIGRLAQNVKVRQRVVASAVTYMRRVYTKYVTVFLVPDNNIFLLDSGCGGMHVTLGLRLSLELLLICLVCVSDGLLSLENSFSHGMFFTLYTIQQLENDATPKLDSLKRSMTEYDPRLVAPACLFLASKAEESTVQARLLVFYIKKLYSDEKFRYDIKDILEMEMKILEALNYYLVVFHPYRSLSQLLQDAGMTEATQICWGLVNDTYKMDLILVHPPHLISLACIYVASVLKDKENTVWFEELRVDMNVVKNIAMEILDFYDNHKMITDERISSAMNKLPSRA